MKTTSKKVMIIILIISGLITVLFPQILKAYSIPSYDIPPTPKEVVGEILSTLIIIFFLGPLGVGIILKIISFWMKRRNKEIIENIKKKHAAGVVLSPTEIKLEKRLRLLDVTFKNLLIIVIVDLFIWSITMYCC